MGRNNVTVRKHYDGSDAYLRCVFFDYLHAEADPDTIVLTITLPDGTTEVKGKGDMTQWVEPDAVDNTGHWQYQHTNAQTGFHKFHVLFTMANGDNGVAIGRWKVI